MRVGRSGHTNQEQDSHHNWSCSSSSTSHEEDINKLHEMFSRTADDVLGHALAIHGTLYKAALSLSTNSSNP